jgi:signal transduction histidine kinase
MLERLAVSLRQAMRFSPDASHELKTPLTISNLRVAVKNAGSGIAPAHAAHRFERFFRADPTSEMQGHGLGLSLAHELTRAHRGDLILTRSDAAWTEFRVTIPLAIAAILRTRRESIMES